MPTFDLVKDESGKLSGLTEADMRAYNRFLKRISELGMRDILKLTWKEPRSGPYHRRHFAMLNALFKAQDTFTDQHVMRKWGEIEAGYCDSTPSRDGVVKIPKSISYEDLDQVEFEPIHNAVFAFYRSEYALGILWPHLSWQKAYEMIDAVLREFD